MPLFHQYAFADYAGAGEDTERCNDIRLWHAGRDGPALRLSPQAGLTHAQAAANPQAGLQFHRNLLRTRLTEILDQSDPTEERVAFGFDHQYSWPAALWDAAQLGEMTWREALHALTDGVPGGRPPLDIPSRFCAAFNGWSGRDLFWCPLQRRAANYEIPQVGPQLPNDTKYRLTELANRPIGTLAPKPANAVGGQGEGVVGGQTICGLRQLARLVDRDDVSWWPFDGLDIQGEVYQGKHVGLEIYPATIRPAEIPAGNDNDAEHSCLYVRARDLADELPAILDLSEIQQDARRAAQVRREGWIVGMRPWP